MCVSAFPASLFSVYVGAQDCVCVSVCVCASRSSLDMVSSPVFVFLLRPADLFSQECNCYCCHTFNTLSLFLCSPPTTTFFAPPFISQLIWFSLSLFIWTHMPCICLSVCGWLHTSWFSACVALPHSSSVSCFLKNSSSQFILGHPHFYFPFSLPPYCFAWLPVSSFFCHFSLFYPPFPSLFQFLQWKLSFTGGLLAKDQHTPVCIWFSVCMWYIYINSFANSCAFTAFDNWWLLLC